MGHEGTFWSGCHDFCAGFIPAGEARDNLSSE
jgi:hypothetical protein